MYIGITELSFSYLFEFKIYILAYFGYQKVFYFEKCCKNNVSVYLISDFRQFIPMIILYEDNKLALKKCIQILF